MSLPYGFAIIHTGELILCSHLAPDGISQVLGEAVVPEDILIKRPDTDLYLIEIFLDFSPEEIRAACRAEPPETLRAGLVLGDGTFPGDLRAV